MSEYYDSRKCDTCRVSSCTVYCHTDLVYLCTACDEHIHAVNSVASRHERVSICTICANAPATSTCNVGLSLCTKCDAEIPSANQTVSRHQRVPLFPIPNFFHEPSFSDLYNSTVQDAEEEMESWLLLDPDNNENQNYDDFSEMNLSGEYFYLGNNASDRVVPVQNMKVNEQQEQKSQDSYVPLEYENSKGELYCTTSTSRYVTAFLDSGIVPNATITNVSNPYVITPKKKSKHSSKSATLNSVQSAQMNRKEKVQRYREKKKARKFEKTIRYASRKASAEIRPRVRGRFSRRIDVQEKKMFSTDDELDHGIVPFVNFNQENKNKSTLATKCPP